MTILQDSIAQSAAVSASYQIVRSLRFNSADSAYLSRTPASAGNRTTWTWSGWIKRSALGTSQYIFSNTDASGLNGFELLINASDQIRVDDYSTVNVWALNTTTQVFRDPAASFHLVLAYDTTQATAANRVRLYINGLLITAFTSATYPAQNYSGYINNTNLHAIGRAGSSATAYLNGLLSDVRFIDGQALDATSFGAFDTNTGVWSPIAYSGSYGTNGYWLKFADNSNTTAATLGADSSGNSNHWTPNNFSITAGVGNDSLVDTPTNYGTDTGAGGEVRGNYCTWNPLFNFGNQTLANGNLDIATGTTGGSIGTMQVSTGKWYWEINYTTAMSTGSRVAGLVKSTSTPTSLITSSIYWQSNGTYSLNNGAGVTYGTSAAVNDVIGVALDVDAQTVTFYKNGSAMGAAISLSSVYSVGDYVTPAMVQSAGTSQSCTANFGQRPFANTAPSGFKALCSTNLPTPAIGATSSTLASKNFDIVTYTGTGANLTVSGLGFQPDFTWIKSRSAAVDHAVYDRVRGVQLDLGTNLTTAETTQATGLTAFNSNGFSIGTLAKINTSAATYVAWNWKANGAPVSNTAGSITSQVSANAAAGISVVSWTGTGANATVGHGLGVVPAMIIVKSRSYSPTSWRSYNKNLANAATTLDLNATTAADGTNATSFNSTAPTSSVFSVGIADNTNRSAATYVAYCFAEVAGFSKFGTYTGNGAADGPFVYCGFRPRWIMVKSTSAVGGWDVFDTARSTENVGDEMILAHVSNTEYSGSAYIDILSNGFKLRNNNTPSGADFNGSSITITFIAFAEAPFNYARAR